MGKANHNAPWTPEQLEELKRLANANTPVSLIALKMGRTREAIQMRARRAGVSLKGG